MPAKDLGSKHVCFKCGTRFYDLKKSEPLCPKCGADQRQSPALKPASEKRVRAPARPVAAPVEPVEETEVAEVEVDEDAEADEDDEDEADEEP